MRSGEVMKRDWNLHRFHKSKHCLASGSVRTDEEIGDKRISVSKRLLHCWERSYHQCLWDLHHLYGYTH